MPGLQTRAERERQIARKRCADLRLRWTTREPQRRLDGLTIHQKMQQKIYILDALHVTRYREGDSDHSNDPQSQAVLLEVLRT